MHDVMAADDRKDAELSATEKTVPEVEEHDTLKYHLLGPSLTKAGQDSVDQQKVSEIIYNASKGSKFFNNEEHKDKNLTIKIARILERKQQLEKFNLASDLRRADDYISELEMTRDLSQTVVHIDCDAFYAAVEELDRPELKEVPMAVGKGVLTTCNYHARKFGCRSGMAGFVAMKLCPNLVCLPLNFEKYTAKAQEVRKILAEYDERFESASIDEAYLNITQYCADHEISPDDAISQLRAEVHAKTHITISAGLAPNAKIAKIASNRNKPNGQFRVANDRSVILAFMRDLPTRKVNGIGRVFERELDAIGIRTCGDIFAQRHLLSKLFGEKAFEFLLQTYLGLGRTKVQPAEEFERKSVGTESTFKDKSSKEELRAQLRWTAEELEKDLRRTQFKGRTLVLKAKLHTYEVMTRQVIPPKAVYLADDLYNFSLPMLAKLEKELPQMRLRLMGLRCTNLVSMKKRTTEDFFGLARQHSTGSASPGHMNDHQVGGNSEWQVWPETEFEAVAAAEREAEFDEAVRLSQEHEEENNQAGSHDGSDLETFDRSYTDEDPLSREERILAESNRRLKHGRVILPNPTGQKETFSSAMRMDSGIGFRKPETGYKERKEAELAAAAAARQAAAWVCPICSRPQEAEERVFNEHVDFCLSRGTIKEAVSAQLAGKDREDPEHATSQLPQLRERENSRDKLRTGGKKRKAQIPAHLKDNKKLFFGTG